MWVTTEKGTLVKQETTDSSWLSQAVRRNWGDRGGEEGFGRALCRAPRRHDFRGLQSLPYRYHWGKNLLATTPMARTHLLGIYMSKHSEKLSYPLVPERCLASQGWGTMAWQDGEVYTVTACLCCPCLEEPQTVNTYTFYQDITQNVNQLFWSFRIHFPPFSSWIR